MADTEVIVTKFEADLTGLEKGVQEYEAALGGASKASDQFDKSAKNLGASTGALAPKFEAVKQSAERTADAIARSREEAAKLILANKNLTDAQKLSAAAAGGISKEYARLAAEQKKTADEAAKLAPKFTEQIGLLNQLKSRIDLLNQKKLALTDPKQIAAVNKELAAANKEFNAVNTSTGALGGQLTSVFNQFAGRIPVVGQFLQALGPIGTATGAIASGLLAIAKNTDAGATAVQGFGIAAGSAFDRVTGAVVSASERVKGFFANFGGDSETASDAFRAFQAVVTSGLSELFRDDLAFGQRIADQLDVLQDKQLDVNEASAKNEVIITRNLAALRDATRPLEERLRLADEITRAEEENLRIKGDQLRAEYEILAVQAGQQQALKGEIDDELKKQLSDTRVSLLAIQREAIATTERVATRVAGINAEADAKTSASAEKALAAYQKAEAERVKAAEARAQAIAVIDKTVESLAFEQRLRTLTDAEREVEIVRKKYADLEAQTILGIAKLRAASPPNAESEITKREADAVIAIDKARDAELLALAQKHAADIAGVRAQNTEALRLSLLNDTQAQQDAILKQLDADLLLSEKTLETQEERDAFRIDRIRKAEAEITGIITAEAQKRLALEQEVADAEKALDEAKTEAAIQATQVIASLLGQSEEAQIAGLALQKGAAVAQIIVQTQAAIAAATAAAAAVPPILPPGIPNPAFAVAQAVLAATVARLKIGAGINIATILAQAIGGAYEGEEYVGRNERPQLPGTRDRYLRRLHKGERVVTADKNREYRDELHAIHTDTYDDLIYHKHIRPAIEAMGFGDQARVNDFTSSDTGQRIAQSVMLAKFYDANIVEELKRSTRTAREQTALLAQIARNGRRNPSRW